MLEQHEPMPPVQYPDWLLPDTLTQKQWEMLYWYQAFRRGEALREQ